MYNGLIRSELEAPLPCFTRFAQRALLLTLATGGVLAQAPRERPRVVLLALDLDHDGQLSAQEIANASQSLLALDRNNDGELTADELEAPRPNSGATPDELAAQLMALDKNGDGVLTRDEVPERLQSLFARADANHDGKLTPDEIRQSAARTSGPSGRRGAPGSAGMNMRLDPVLFALDANHDGILSSGEIRNSSAALLALDGNHDGIIEATEMRVRQQTPEERTDHLLDEWDTNKDGKLSVNELPDGLRPRFTEADKNADGYLDRAELIQMFSAQQPTVTAQPKGKPD